jgi:hypothetical protein
VLARQGDISTLRAEGHFCLAPTLIGQSPPWQQPTKL